MRLWFSRVLWVSVALGGIALSAGCAPKKIDAQTSQAVNADMQAKAAAGQTGMGQPTAPGSTGAPAQPAKGQ